jgi:hypothetical protein
MPALPQVSMPPQPSEMVPQLLPSASHVVFLQQVWFARQTSVVASQVPQAMTGSPQPAGALPHAQPFGHATFGTHTPHTLAVPVPPHVSPCPVQAPQCSTVPHPSFMSSQFLPPSQIAGVQHLFL